MYRVSSGVFQVTRPVRMRVTTAQATRIAVTAFRDEDCRTGRAWYAATVGAALAAGVSVAASAAAAVVGDSDAVVQLEGAADGSPSDSKQPGGVSTAHPVYFKRSEVEAADGRRGRVLVTYKDGVYDVSEFLQSHPGGQEKLMMAAGGAVEPFWTLYRQHLTPFVLEEVLPSLRVGSLDPSETPTAPISNANDPFRNDPHRHPALVVRQAQPFNAETPLSLLGPDTWVTPIPLWYIRHHHPVPHLDPATFAVDVAVEAGRPGSHSFSLSELKSLFPKRTVTATMQCGGNRRSEFDSVGPTQGLKWSAGVISTATWGGVFLRDVLSAAGVPHDPAHTHALGVKHVQFIAADSPYDASIPTSIALDPRRDVLLAYEMNGEPIPAEHGGPLRAIVPGTIGARNVKWVTRVVASGEESHSTWQRGLPYKGIPPGVKSFAGVEPASLPSVYDTPVQSAIANVAEGSTIEAEPESVAGKGLTINVTGYAYSGGGRRIVRVDVSADGGTTWTTADLTHGHDQPLGRAWAWTLWSADVPVPAVAVAKGGGQVTLTCKAVDEAFNAQPEDASAIWNLRGILNNSWHRVIADVKIDS
jgi:sulfite oxidase